MTLSAKLGATITAGNIKACYIDQGGENGLILLPGEETMVVALEKNCPGDVIRRLLYE